MIGELAQLRCRVNPLLALGVLALASAKGCFHIKRACSALLRARLRMLRTKVLELRHMNKKIRSSEVIKEKLGLLLAKPIFTRADIESIEALKNDLAIAEERESETLRIMAGIKWREEGEKSNKYFLSKFKSRTNAVT